MIANERRSTAPADRAAGALWREKFFQRPGHGAELIDRQLIAQADYDQRLALMKVRQSDLTRARNNLDYTRLVAPFDGIIARRLAENFETVSNGQVVLTLNTAGAAMPILEAAAGDSVFQDWTARLRWTMRGGSGR